MEEDFSIEVEEEVKKIDNEVIQLPMNFITIGNVEPDDVKIYIHEDIFNRIEEYSKSNTKKELGSILIGNVSEELGKTHVIVSDFIEAKYTDASVATLTFTHESWEYINKEYEKNYKNKKIIGWQHTHPNYGIFLSNYDMFIQENFFNLPFQIAYVVDPIQNIRGFFQWKNGKVQKCSGYYIYNDIGIKIKQKIPKIREETLRTKKSFSNITLLFMFVLFSILSLAFYTSLNDLNNKYTNMVELFDSNTSLKEEKHNEDKVVQVVEDSKNPNSIVFEKYIIRKGDTLLTICQKYNLDINEFRDVIKSVNGIENENEIFADKVILLPTLEV